MFRTWWCPAAVSLVGMASTPSALADDSYHADGAFEVWLVDQSDSPGKTYGGTLYIWEGADLISEDASSAPPVDVLDLGEETATLCLARTGANPVRPHMLTFNNAATHGVLTFVASGHVVFFDTLTRRPVECLRMSPGAGGVRQAHAAWPSPDDELILVANQNGKLLERVWTNYADDVFEHDTDATLNLATCTTPNGLPCQDPELRPDNAPICPFIPSRNDIGYVSLRGGGMLVVNPSSRHISILAEYDANHVGPNGCGFAEASGSVFFNSGGGTAAHLSGFDVYRLPMFADYAPDNPPNTPAVDHLFSDDSPDRDAHGLIVTKDERYVWVLDRAANVAEIFSAWSGRRINTVNLVSRHSADPTPDLGDLSPSGDHMFISLRGPTPLSGDPHASTGTTPGLGVVKVRAGGKRGLMKAIVRIHNFDTEGVEHADAHAVRVLRK